MPYNSCYIIDGGGTALIRISKCLLKKIYDSFVHHYILKGNWISRNPRSYQTKKYKKLICIIGDGNTIEYSRLTKHYSV